MDMAKQHGLPIFGIAPVTWFIQYIDNSIHLNLVPPNIWMGIDPETVSYTPSTAFLDIVDLGQFGTINTAVSAGNLPNEVLYEAARKSGLTDLTNDEMDDLIEMQTPSLIDEFGNSVDGAGNMFAGGQITEQDDDA